MKTYKKVLAIAGTDPGGCAGVQADIKTASACACFSTSAVTAVLAQNTMGVRHILPLPINTVIEQIKAVLDDMGTDSVKIGMLHNSEIILAISKVLQEYEVSNIVLDPVMVATSGDKLLEDEAINTLKTELIPKVRVITPNIPEAEILLGEKIKVQSELPNYAKILGEKYGVSVLLKAGHLTEKKLIDVLYNAETDELLSLESQRINTKNTHGTGCTLSSALAAFLAQGLSLNSAAEKAKKYINEALLSGANYELGKGSGPVHHFYDFWT